MFTVYFSQRITLNFSAGVQIPLKMLYDSAMRLIENVLPILLYNNIKHLLLQDFFSTFFANNKVKKENLPLFVDSFKLAYIIIPIFFFRRFLYLLIRIGRLSVFSSTLCRLDAVAVRNSRNSAFRTVIYERS